MYICSTKRRLYILRLFLSSFFSRPDTVCGKSNSSKPLQKIFSQQYSRFKYTFQTTFPRQKMANQTHSTVERHNRVDRECRKLAAIITNITWFWPLDASEIPRSHTGLVISQLNFTLRRLSCRGGALTQLLCQKCSTEKKVHLLQIHTERRSPTN